jgi:uncharacterized protein YceK
MKKAFIIAMAMLMSGCASVHKDHQKDIDHEFRIKDSARLEYQIRNEERLNKQK